MMMLGLVGCAYAPQDSYYVGIWSGLIDDPLTLEDDLDRAHYMLGFVVAIPAFLIDAYGTLLNERWLWHGLNPREISVASRLLLSLQSADQESQREALTSTPRESQAKILRALRSMEFIRIGSQGVTLHAKSREFFGL